MFFVVNLKNFALEVNDERNEYVLKASIFIPSTFNIFLIHLTSVCVVLQN